MLCTRLLFAGFRTTSTTAWSAPRGEEAGHRGIETWVDLRERAVLETEMLRDGMRLVMPLYASDLTVLVPGMAVHRRLVVRGRCHGLHGRSVPRRARHWYRTSGCE